MKKLAMMALAALFVSATSSPAWWIFGKKAADEPAQAEAPAVQPADDAAAPAAGGDKKAECKAKKAECKAECKADKKACQSECKAKKAACKADCNSNQTATTENHTLTRNAAFRAAGGD